MLRFTRMARRPYDNRRRLELAAATREKILTAVRDLLLESPRDVSIQEIAAKADVAEPTVYRHFPNRDALLAAAAETVSQHLGAPPLAETADELPAAVLAVAAYFDANAAWLRAGLSEPSLRAMRVAGRSRRVAHMRRLLEPRVQHLTARERDLVVAAVASLARAESWDTMTREFGLTSEEAGRALSWGVQAMLDAIAAGRRQRKTHLVDAATIAKGRAWPAHNTAQRRKDA